MTQHGPRRRQSTVPTFIAAVAVALLGVAAITAVALLRHDRSSSRPELRPLGTGNTDRKMLWVHSIPDSAGLNDPTAFGANYPLYYKNVGTGNRSARSAANVGDALAAGVDALNVNVFLSKPDSLMAWMNPYFASADKTSLLLAPTLNVATAPPDPKLRLDLAEANMRSYCVHARKHRSAAIYDGRLVVFVFSANLMPPSFWSTLKSHLTSSGCATYFVLNVPQSFCQGRQACFKRYLDATDRAWSFSGLSTEDFRQTSAAYDKLNRPFIGGMWPRLFSSAHGADVLPIRARPADPRGTEFYRQEWETQLAAHLPWASVSTLDDFSEHTNIDPSSDWNFTLTDLTAWYAARLREAQPPWRDAHAYLTTPQALYRGQSAVVEGLMLNGSGKAVDVAVSVLDADGRPLGPASHASVAAGSLGVTSVTVKCPAQATMSTWIRARIITAGRSVVGAPTLCYPAQPPADAFVLYYSVPVAHSLAVAVTLTADGGKVTVGSPGVRARFTEVLRDTQSMGNTFTEPLLSRFLSALPLATKSTMIDNRGDARKFDLLVARVIDSRGAVGYSMPIRLP